MRKLVLAAAIILFAGMAFGQTLQKGCVIGVHTLTITLNPGVTMDQYQDYVNTTFIPEWEKNFPGGKLFVGQGLNREIEGKYAMLVYLDSKKVYNKYWNDDGSATDAGTEAVSRIQAVLEEMNKLGTFTSEISDWVIQ